MKARTQAFSYRHLLSVAEIASAIATAKRTAGVDELRKLTQYAESGESSAALYPPHQLWQHGGDANRIGVPTVNASSIWRSLAAKVEGPHMSDKDAFSYPTAASTWHMLAADVYALAQQPAWSALEATVLRELACRYSPKLMGETATPAPPSEPALVDTLPAQAQAQAAAPAPAKPLQRGSAQDAMILTAIRKAGHNPLALPVNEPGKAGVKAEIRNALRNEKLLTGSTVFDKAWERLRKQGDIADTD